MTDPLREQLQAALGGAYTIERELGGGGMARVNVAEETAFGRRVVAVKMSVPIECACQYKLRLTRAMAFDGRGNTDSAIVWYDRYMQPLMLRGAALAPIQRRLGELYEATGDVEHALTWYGRFLETWKHADLELRPQTEDVTRRVARLRAREAAKR